MSIDYKIKAFPTKYRGITYRSRLEASWAAFFDKIGWSHAYEPYDLGAWSPDFLVNGRVLVEVKPITEPDDGIIEKITRACSERGIYKEESEISGALLVGVSPIPAETFPLVLPPKIGWYINQFGVFAVDLRWCLDINADRPRVMADLFHSDNRSWFSVLGGDAGPGRCIESQAFPQYTMGLWGRAIAEVQYKAPQ